MNYPQDFVNRCKQAYPDWQELHVRLDRGDAFVGRYLDDAAPLGIKPERIIELFEAGRPAEVLAEARAALVKHLLYVEWGKLYRAQPR